MFGLADEQCHYLLQDGKTAMFCAAAAGDVEVVSALVEGRAAVDVACEVRAAWCAGGWMVSAGMLGRDLYLGPRALPRSQVHLE